MSGLHGGEMFLPNIAPLQVHSYPFIRFIFPYSYPVVLIQEKCEVVVKLLSQQDICCQTLRARTLLRRYPVLTGFQMFVAFCDP